MAWASAAWNCGSRQEGLLRRVRDERGLGQDRRHARRSAEDAVVVAPIAPGSVLGSRVPVGHPRHVEGSEGPHQLLVEQAGRPLRLRRGDLEVGLGTRSRTRAVGLGVVVDGDEHLRLEAGGDGGAAGQRDPVVAGPGEHHGGPHRLEPSLGLLGDRQVHRLLGGAGRAHRSWLVTTVARIEHHVGAGDRRASDGHLCSARRPGQERAVAVGREHGEDHAVARRHSARGPDGQGRPGDGGLGGRGGGRSGSWWWCWWVTRRWWSSAPGSRPRDRRRPGWQLVRRRRAPAPPERRPAIASGPSWRPGSHRRRRGGTRGRYRPLTTSTMSVPASVGFWPTRTPAACSASCLAAAVPLPPETMAPAWPIFLPGGAVTPAT